MSKSMQTIATCTLTALGGRQIFLNATYIDERIIFDGNAEPHSIAGNSSPERIKAHFKGYCEHRATCGLWTIEYTYF